MNGLIKKIVIKNGMYFVTRLKILRPKIFFFLEGSIPHTPKIEDENTQDISHKIAEDRIYIVQHFCLC